MKNLLIIQKSRWFLNSRTNRINNSNKINNKPPFNTQQSKAKQSNNRIAINLWFSKNNFLTIVQVAVVANANAVIVVVVANVVNVAAIAIINKFLRMIKKIEKDLEKCKKEDASGFLL